MRHITPYAPTHHDVGIRDKFVVTVTRTVNRVILLEVGFAVRPSFGELLTNQIVQQGGARRNKDQEAEGQESRERCLARRQVQVRLQLVV